MDGEIECVGRWKSILITGHKLFVDLHNPIEHILLDGQNEIHCITNVVLWQDETRFIDTFMKSIALRLTIVEDERGRNEL